MQMENNTKNTVNRYKHYATDLKRYYRMPFIQTSLTSVLSLLIVAFFIFVALKPTLATISRLKQKIQDSKQTLTKLDAKVNALQKISTLQPSYSPLIPYVDNLIPQDGPRYQTVVGMMELIASENKVKISSNTQGEALTYSKIADPYSGISRVVVSMPINFRVSGLFVDISRFFEALLAADRLISIDSISFTREVQKQDSLGLISFNVSGNVHYLANDAMLRTILPSLKNQQNDSKVEENPDVVKNWDSRSSQL